ncbi:uncharacterized protein AAG666_007998 isoform 3-T3 [Megaptera novaeangliae]
MTMTPGVSLSTFTAVPFPPPIPGAQHRPPWQQHLPRPITPAFPPGSSLLLPAFPRTPLVANGGRGPSAPGACNLTVQVRSQGRTVEVPQTQTFVVTQAPLNWSAPGALSRSVACPAPVFRATPVMGTVETASAVGVSQAGKGGWTPGFPPQAPPPAAQLAPIIRPVNSGPWPHGTSREGRLATNQSNASQDGSSNTKSEYSNFLRWQHVKPLARRHFCLSPDAEAFSCFLIPVLRSVARLNPTMLLEEGLWRAVQKWRRLSNLDRMIYYETAQKFMEFAAEEEMHIQNLQWVQCAQDLPPPAPPKLDPRGPPAPKVGLQPGTQVPTGAEGTACAPRMSGPRAQPSHPKPHRSQRTPEPKAPKEIPPEAVREDVDRMEALAGPVHSATGKSAPGKSDAEGGKAGNELKQEEDDTYLDPCLLSYTDELRSREHSVTKVEAVIHPRFPAELFSPDPQLDVSALAEEPKQEEGLTPEEGHCPTAQCSSSHTCAWSRHCPPPSDQLVQKRLLALKEDEGGPAAPSHSAPGLGSSPSESHAGQGAQRHDQDRHRGVSDEACPPEIDVEALHRPIRTDTGPFMLRVFVPSRGRQAGKGGWTPGFPPQAPPPAAQLAPIIRPVNSGPRPHGTSREGRLATNQSNASQDGSSNTKREYSNFLRWQHIKPLARRHFHLSPDAEAFSCFLIPVLRSVARLNPTMLLEEGLWRAVQKWRRLSNLDRMIYYETAQKFMEFAAEEEMHIQNLQWVQCAQDLPPPAPPKLDPRGPPAPKVGLQPGTQVPTGAEGTACAPRMSGPRAQPSHPKPHRSQRTPEPKAPKEIPPEAVREDVDRMEALAGPVHSATGKSAPGKSDAEGGKAGNELKQEEDDTYLDPCLLSYTDELRSREHSVTKVEAVIHPRFPAELFSPDPQLDVSALAEEPKQEEGLTPEELVQKRLLALKEDEGGPAAPSHSAPGLGSSPSESHAGQGAQRHDQDRHRGVSDEACPPEIDVEALHRPIRTDTGPFMLRVFVPSRGRQAGKGGWTPGFPPQAPPPAAQLAPIIRPVNSGPRPHGTSREGRLATNQSNASQDGSSNTKREYSNFLRWQHIKPLARRHFHLSPDAEAFSCFLIPVLRSVARLNPTMLLEEGLWRAVQKWRRLSNLDRMIYYETAQKFMEFAAEEEMHIQNLQWVQCAQDLPPPAPPKLDPRGPPAPKVGLQPGTQVPTGAEGTACAPRMSGPRAQPSHPKPHRSQRTPEPKAPKEIPPEAVREDVDRMEALAGPVHSATGKSAPGKSDAEGGKAGNELKQEEDDTYLDPCLLSYTDELRSREHSVTKVEAVIHPRFPAELFSPDPQLDVSALAEEPKQEEGLTPEEGHCPTAQCSSSHTCAWSRHCPPPSDQLVQKRLLALKEDEGGPAAPSHSAPGMGSSPSESHAGQGAQRHDQDRHRGVSDEACPPEIDVEALHRPIRADTGPFGPKVFVPCRGRQGVSASRAGRPYPPQGQRRTGPRLGPRDASVLREAPPVREARGPRDAAGEDEKERPSLASLLASAQSLPPCRLSQRPAPASGLASPGGWGAQSAPQAPSPQRRGLSPAPPAAPKSRKRALCGRPAAAEKLPIPGAAHGVSARPALALGLARPSQPRKRKRDPFVTGKRRNRKRKRCSQ